VCDRLALALALALLAAPVAAAAQSGVGDPTRPTSLSEPDEAAGRAVPQGPRWRLQSTLVADSRRLAVINGRTVAQGGRVDGATVLEVRQDGVTLDLDGERINLKLLPGSLDVKRSGG
jgi:MSHA biogenesis protein MshK